MSAEQTTGNGNLQQDLQENSTASADDNVNRGNRKFDNLKHVHVQSAVLDMTGFVSVLTTMDNTLNQLSNSVTQLSSKQDQLATKQDQLALKQDILNLGKKIDKILTGESVKKILYTELCKTLQDICTDTAEKAASSGHIDYKLVHQRHERRQYHIQEPLNLEHSREHEISQQTIDSVASTSLIYLNGNTQEVGDITDVPHEDHVILPISPVPVSGGNSVVSTEEHHEDSTILDRPPVDDEDDENIPLISFRRNSAASKSRKRGNELEDSAGTSETNGESSAGTSKCCKRFRTN